MSTSSRFRAQCVPFLLSSQLSHTSKRLLPTLTFVFTQFLTHLRQYHAVSSLTPSFPLQWLAAASAATPSPVNNITPPLVLRFPGNQRLATTTTTDLLSPIEAGCPLCVVYFNPLPLCFNPELCGLLMPQRGLDSSPYCHPDAFLLCISTHVY